jgi:hypothetical protein
MGLLNGVSGGHNDEANNDLNQAWSAFDQVGVPTTDQLSLPQLQQYVQAGIMNAMDKVTTDPKAKEAEITALNQLQDVASSKGHDAQSEAKLAQTQSTMNQNMQGQRASILDQMAARGVPTSLMGTAAQMAAAGQDNQQAHADALQSNSDAANRALTAMSQAGSLGGNIEAQNFGEGATKAQSQNAIDQWNAANQTNVNLANQQAQQQSNLYNNQTAQAVSGANVQNANARTQYNAQTPQTVFNDKMAKAGGQAGVDMAKAGQQTQQGQQNAALVSGAVGAGAGLLGTMYGGPTGGAAAKAGSDAMLASHGAQVPGVANVPGDSPVNDTVNAKLSPGEIVIPRSHASSPNLAAEFVRHLHKAPVPKVHPDDVKHVLHALTAMRGGF